MRDEKSQDILNHLRHYHKYGKIIEQRDVCDLIFLNFKPENHIRKVGRNEYLKVKRTKITETVEIDDTTRDGKVLTVREREIIKYIPDENGEAFTMSKTGERNKRSLRKIFNDLRYLINTNFFQDHNHRQFFITLTYKENMQDYKRLYNDFQSFFRKLKRQYKAHELAYIVIMEPQGRGAWHAHLLLKVLSNGEFRIDFKNLRETWGQGRIRVEQLYNVDNLGSYFIAYMSNAEIDDKIIEQLELKPDDIKEKDGKRYIKGTRLNFYKDYMKIYRSSRNIKKPEHIELSEDIIGAAENLYPNITHQTLKEIPVLKDNEEIVLKIGKEQRRRKKKP